MKVEPSGIPGVLIHGQDAPEFASGLSVILGRAPKSLLQPALPFSVILTNTSSRGIAFIGVRFDMTSARGQQCSVVHYADTLRNPAKAEFQPGAHRFFCAEPAYTALVLRGDAAAETRGRMNLDNLRRMLQVRASLDCIAFDDGESAGPDSQQAFERLALEREAESAFLVKASGMSDYHEAEAFLVRAVEASDERVLRSAARKLMSALETAGMQGMADAARDYKLRIPLFRSAPL